MDFDDRLPWKKTTGAITATEILRGSDETGLVVVLADSDGEPTSGDLHAMWKARAGQSADPVLVMVSYPTIQGPRVAVLGPDRDAVLVSAVEEMTAARLAAAALTTDSPIGLLADVRRKLASLRGGTGPGFRNEGLFATHVLAQQPQRPDWPSLSQRSARLLSDRGEHLLTSLGYEVDHVPDGIVLRDTVDKRRHAAAVLLLDDESFDNPLGRFAGTTAVTHGLALARREGVPWLIVLGGSVARLYPANPDVGVGRKGQTQTYVEVDLDLLSESNAGYLALLFSPEALADGGTVAALLAESSKYATGLSERLRDRIYEDVIPNLAVAIAAAHNVWDLPAAEQRAALDEAYHQAMIVLFRLLFVAYAEDRALLPLDVNEAYTSNALKTLARRILNDPDSGFSETSTSMWADLIQIWDVIDTGDLEGMGVPAYNGGLFTRDPAKNPSGAATYGLRLTNAEIGPVLRGLMIDYTDDDVLGLVDFRSLDVREFGTIYEGLLESGLGIADTDLTVDSNDTYVPAGKKGEVWIEEGSIYFHSRSGSRKATGSYFTKPFAVQHLLDQALEPALDNHLTKVKDLLDKGAHRSAADLLFDFRVADLAMGSAHFLVAAIDRIEARFSAFIALNPMPEVLAELHSLRETAAAQLGIPAEDSGIDDGVLLRRQIARRCIYGIDINEIAVELARLAVWIHTFVPGLPLSFLNHGLIHGNSLTGVGTLDEIVQALSEAEERETKTTGGQSWLLQSALTDFVERAGANLDRLAQLADASIADVEAALALQEEITDALEPLSALCDLVTAERTTRHLKKADPDKILLSAGGGQVFTASDAASLEASILAHPQLQQARQIAQDVQATHLPSRYPEVFRRDPAGFDVLLGNPPWKELTVEEVQFWAIRYPGIKAMDSAAQQNRIAQLRSERPDFVKELESTKAAFELIRRVLLAGPYDGIGQGDPDIYKAFAWRNWSLLRLGGKIGIIVPRSLWTTKSGSEWRCTVLPRASTTIDLCRNTDNWLFDDVNAGYQVTLLSMQRVASEGTVGLRGEFTSRSSFDLGVQAKPQGISIPQLAALDPLLCIPSVNDEESLELFSLLTRQPGLGDGRLPTHRKDVRAAPATEIHASNDGRDGGIFSNDSSDHPVFNHLNVGSFAFDRTVGAFNYADFDQTVAWLSDGRRRTHGSKVSPFSIRPLAWSSDERTLPTLNARLVFRDVVHASNKKKVWFALCPRDTLLTNTAPYLVFDTDSVERDAYVLGVLNSAVVDWYGHLRIGLHLNFFILYGLPLPTWDAESPVHRRIGQLAARLGVVPGESYGGQWESLAVAADSLDEHSARLELESLVSKLFGIPDRLLSQIFDGNPTRPSLEEILEARASTPHTDE